MQQVYRFAGFTLDTVSGCLASHAGEAPLRPKSFEVLRYLVENPGRLVSKDELVDAVWARVAVTDDSVAQCISEIRQAIGDRQQWIIRTFPRRGYRFDVPVDATAPASMSESPEAAAPAPVLTSARWARVLRRPWATAAAGGLLLLVLVWVGVRSHPPPAAADRATIAVLRFANLSPDSGQDYLAEGLSEDLIAGLSKSSSLFVIARHSAFAAGNEPADAKEIGRELGARYLLLGSVRREGDRLRITARLVDAEAGPERWAETYDQSYIGLFRLQDELTRKIVGTLVPRLNQSELARSLRKTPQSLTAYDYYLRGNSLLKNRGGAHRGEMVQQARELLEAAIAADPDYARRSRPWRKRCS
jgi:adenylate cyclase